MHQRSLKLILVAAAVAAIPACYATGGYGYSTGYVAAPTVQAGVAVDANVAVAAPQVDATVAVGGPAVAVAAPAPQLVTVDTSPTVQVFADYNEPIFFTDNTYWRFQNNNWYSSSTYTGGWAYNASVPYAVRSIDRPDRYRNYRPAGYVPRNNGYVNNRGGYRNDNRGYDNRGGYNNGGSTYVPPARGHNSGWQQPARGGYTQPTPARGGYTQPTPARGGYTQPSGGYAQPKGGYVPPTRGYNSGWSQPKGGYTQPTPARGGYTQPTQPRGGYTSPPPRGNTGYTPANNGYRPSGGYTAPAQRTRDHRASTPASSGGTRRASTRDHRR